MFPATSKFSQCDKLHLKELVDLLYPIDKSLAKLSKKTVNESTTLFNSSLSNVVLEDISKIYHCRQIQTTFFKNSVDHWIKEHYLAAKTVENFVLSTQNDIILDTNESNLKRCKCYADLGNEFIPLSERARFFLNYVNNFPTPCNFYRSYKNQDPRSIKNPFIAALSIAYDFIDTIKHQNTEYHYFISRLTNKPLEHSYSNVLQDHLRYWMYWSDYHYPILDKKVAKISQMPYQTQVLSSESLEPVQNKRFRNFNSQSFKIPYRPRKNP